MKFGRIVLALATALSLTMGAWAQEKTEKKAAMKKKAAEAVEEKKAAAEKTVEKKAAPAEKKVEAAEKKATEKVAEKKAEKKMAAKKGAPYTGGMVNINTATKTQLMALPGVGEANADHIIKGRPYKSADELISRKIVQPHYYDDFKQYVTTK